MAHRVMDLVQAVDREGGMRAGCEIWEVRGIVCVVLHRHLIAIGIFQRYGISTPLLTELDVEDGPSLDIERREDGLITGLTYSSGLRQDLTLNVQGHLTEFNGLSGRTQFTYNAQGQLETTTLRNGVEETRVYDENGFLIRVDRPGDDFDELVDRDLLGRVTKYTLGDFDLNYTYDQIINAQIEAAKSAGGP